MPKTTAGKRQRELTQKLKRAAKIARKQGKVGESQLAAMIDAVAVMKRT